MLEAGFDSVELGASSLLAHYDAYAALRPKSMNLFFPGSIRLFGPEATEWRPYVDEMLPAAASVGAEVLVVGSGGQRRAPEHWSAADRDAAFAEFVAEMQALAPAGLRLAPEALNATETNTGNSLPRLAEALAVRGCGYTADSYHSLFEMGEAVDWDAEIPFCPTHVHLGNRSRKGISADDPELIGFARRVRELGFDGIASIEVARAEDMASALAAWLRDVRTLLAA
ncbi:MAG: sugar phosphate isomerase/epimerase family protein [Fimbriimonas sp.]